MIERVEAVAKYVLEYDIIDKEGDFLLSEPEAGCLHVGWWDAEQNEWTTEIKNEGKDVGELFPIAKITLQITTVPQR